MEPVRGYRINSTQPIEKELKVDYLRLKTVAAHALQKLQRKVLESGANCVGREDEFTGNILPTDEQAERMCVGCPARQECAIFLEIGRPAYGVWAGKVRGRDLADDGEGEGE